MFLDFPGNKTYNYRPGSLTCIRFCCKTLEHIRTLVTAINRHVCTSLDNILAHCLHVFLELEILPDPVGPVYARYHQQFNRNWTVNCGCNQTDLIIDLWQGSTQTTFLWDKWVHP